MRGSPLQPLRLGFFVINFPSHPCSQFPFLVFFWKDSITRVKSHRSHERAQLPNLPTQDISRPPPPPIIHLSTAKVIPTLSYSASLCAAGGIFSLSFSKNILRSITLFFLFYCLVGREGGGRL